MKDQTFQQRRVWFEHLSVVIPQSAVGRYPFKPANVIPAKLTPTTNHCYGPLIRAWHLHRGPEQSELRQRFRHLRTPSRTEIYLQESERNLHLHDQSNISSRSFLRLIFSSVVLIPNESSTYDALPALLPLSSRSPSSQRSDNTTTVPQSWHPRLDRERLPLWLCLLSA